MEPTLQNAIVEIERYHARYRNPALARPEVCEPYRLPDDWRRSYFGAGHSGVYLFVDADEQVQYVGKSREMGTRLGWYLKHQDKSRETHEWKDPDTFGSVSAIVFVKLENAFEAPALEDFLIGRLQPAINKQGKRTNWT